MRSLLAPLAPLLRLLPSPKSGAGLFGYALFVLSPVLTVAALLGHADLIADNVDLIASALRTWWVYPLLMLFGFLLLLYAGYKQQPGQRQQAENVTPTDTDPRQVQELEYENQQLRQNLEAATAEAGLPPDVATRRDIANCSFRLVDLLRLAGTDGSYIVGKNFENCTIYGPGIVTREGKPPGDSGTYATVSQVPTLYVEGNPDSVLYEVLPNAVTSAGVIHLVGCSYRRVTFSGVGIAGSPEEIQSWREHVTFSEGV